MDVGCNSLCQFCKLWVQFNWRGVRSNLNKVTDFKYKKHTGDTDPLDAEPVVSVDMGGD